MLDTAFFYAFGALTLLGAILTVTLRNAVHCAVALIASLAGVAGLFLLLSAEFLFAVQIILYIGGVMVLFLFVIMLVNLDLAAKERQFQRHWRVALVCVAGVGVLFVTFLLRGRELFRLSEPAPPMALPEGNTQALADLLFREYLVPFELASILLLVAIIGSVMMAKKRA
jgi:NADH dehydrogenase subunit J (EC 1.6.5.3)